MGSVIIEKIIPTLINGLSLGGIYAMIALGYTMVYGIAKMLNFAHGDIIMVGGYTLLVVMNLCGMPLIAILIAAIVCPLFGIIIEKLAYKPLRGASPLAVLITAIGVSYLLQSIAQIVFGTQSKIVNFGKISELGSLTIGSATIEYTSIITLLSTIIVMVLLSLFIKCTKIGRAMIAVSEDKGAAELMGINVNSIISITFLIGSFLAAIAGLFLLFKAPTIYSTFGSMPGIKAFTAAVIGGIGSIPGAMLGGFLLGIVETVTSMFPKISPYTDAIEFGILIIILLIKPTGFLGKKRREKV